MPIRRSNQKSVASRFSAAADSYDRHAGIQSRVASRLTGLLANRPVIKSILEIGCGTGLLTAKLAKKFPLAAICATDISKGMIVKSNARFKTSKRIKWITGDFRDLSGLGKFNLVTSSSSLHWITPLKTTFSKVSSLLGKDGTFAFSIMVKGTLAELHSARKKIAPAKTVKRQLLLGREVINLLGSSGLAVVESKRASYRAVFRSASCFLKSLHEQGVTSGPFASGRELLNRCELERLVSYYDEHYKCSGGVFATYQVLYVVAKK